MKSIGSPNLRQILALVIMLAAASSALAKKDPGGVDPGATPGAGNPKTKGGPPDQRMLGGLQQRIEASDEEWKVLGPRLYTVTVLSKRLKDLRDPKKSLEAPKPPKGDAAGDRANPEPPLPNVMIELAQRAADLRLAWEDKSIRGDDIQARLAKFRDVRTRADRQTADDLAKARQELRELLTARQELALMMTGLLD